MSSNLKGFSLSYKGLMIAKFGQLMRDMFRAEDA